MKASIALGHSGLEVSPLVLGGNVFGWTLDEHDSLRVLSAACEAGITSIDTADLYSVWVDGHTGGESERIIGTWLKRNPGKRDRLTLITKVGAELGTARGGLSRRWIMKAVDDSLRRLNTDYIDLYFSHYPDPHTPNEETLGAYADLLAAGKIRAIGASNFSLEQLQDAETCTSQGLPGYSALQLEYNLHDRADYEQHLRGFAMERGLGVLTYFSLASGFLTGKYASLEDTAGHPRAGDLQRFFTARGMRILAALRELAAQRQAQMASVALAWLMQRQGVTAPVVSVTSQAQLTALLQACELQLDEDEVQLLDTASACMK